ncbi:FkbM family methyltransferase [Candidatus Pelagibacter communis]|uniref:FkbM family methyltransferase n=1 Tax=Pelagibacter ubique TaxID=198252 RepID=UPI00094C5A84|nr:FkbM family methyltransferase [Candidatus Pelagibacter ubique]|tara:strand:+ start:262 stop:1068 length:807 start_codon:yes stop_codon:yes gene_type:complete
MKTKYKIFVAKILSSFLRFFISNIQEVKRNKIFWLLDLNEGIDLSIFLFGTFEKKILKLEKILKKQSNFCFLDIGANIGSVSLPLAKSFKNCKIFAIEPTDYAFRKLEKNLSLNSDIKARVDLNQVFISNQKKPKKVWSSWNLNDKDDVHKTHKGKLMEVRENSYIALNDFINMKGIEKVDFIKIDVDGYELDVLKSGFEYLKENKPIIFIEIAPYLYPEFGYNVSELIGYIKNIGYDFHDDNLKKIKDTELEIKNIKFGSSKNYFLY